MVDIDYSCVRRELEFRGFKLFLKEGNLLNFKHKFIKNDILITIDWYMGGFIKKITIDTKNLNKEYNQPNKSFFKELKNYIN